MSSLFLDLETFSDIPIQNGSYKYSEHVEILLFAYAIDDGYVKLWELALTKEMPQDLRAAIEADNTIFIGHNIGGFDRIMIEKALNITLPVERIHDTMARAYAHGLPGSLDLLCDLMQAPVSKAKDKEGKKFINLFCKPKSDGTRNTHKTHPLEYGRFCSYAKLDIEATRYIYEKMPNWNYKGFEYNLWCLDQKINRKGIFIDTDLIEAAIKTVDRTQKDLRKRTLEITNGELDSTTRRDALLQHILKEYDIELPDMQASTLERRIDDPDLPEALKELLKIRVQATTSSTAKYNKIIKCVSADGRLRGTLQWCGASRTGRDAGRILNPQNLPRPTLPQEDINFGIEALKADCADIFFDDVMSLASNTIRGVIAAPPGKKLLIADLSNIEGRYAAWISNEKWKLQAFKDYDQGSGPDLYALAYARSFHVTPESVMEDKKNGGNQRQIGKTMELALQFGGGCGAFVTFAIGFGIDLNQLVEQGYETIPAEVKREAEDFWQYAVKQKRTLDLEKEVFVTCDSLKRLWRKTHPNTVSTWKELEEAVRNAIETPKTIFSAQRLKAIRNGNWLRVISPSGRSLCYPAPRVNDEGEISFMGMDQYTRRFQRISTYGPKIFENGVQGGARDVFMQGVVNADQAGYDCIMRIHDEQISEVLDDEKYSVRELCHLMTTNIPWAQGLPLAASGFESLRYRKSD